MELLINSDLLNKCGSGSSEYWFSYRDFVSIGLIPFITISNEEIIRGFINEKGSEKLKSILDKIQGEEFIDTFWKYFNAYPELKDGIDEFSTEYTHNKIASWCNENNINYRFE